jgi:hypothetical protein
MASRLVEKLSELSALHLSPHPKEWWQTAAGATSPSISGWRG